MAERTAANPNSADILYTVAKEELKKFEVSAEVDRRNRLQVFLSCLLVCF